MVSALSAAFPHEDIIYFGDTARVPYGNKSRTTIMRFSDEITRFLVSKGVKLLIAACNTASSLALPSIERKCEVPAIGVVKSGVRQALREAPSGRIGVIATSSTVKSGAYEKEFRKILPDGRICSRACPLFVALVENGFIDDQITRLAAEKYLAELRSLDLEALILGCTHYPAIKGVIKSVMGPVKLIDSSEAVSEEAGRVLAKKRLLSGRGRGGRISCFVSDDVEQFEQSARIFLKNRIRVRKAVL